MSRMEILKVHITANVERRDIMYLRFLHSSNMKCTLNGDPGCIYRFMCQPVDIIHLAFITTLSLYSFTVHVLMMPTLNDAQYFLVFCFYFNLYNLL